MSKHVRSRVEEWLRTIGCTPSERDDDDDTIWHIEFDYPVKSGNRMHVVSPKTNPQAIIIAVGTSVASQHLKAFEDLDEDGKDEFLWELRNTLNQPEVDFKFENANGRFDCPSQFQVSVTRYEDGLATLDAFAQCIGAAYKTYLKAIWVFQRHLSNGGRGPSGRFDFERLGF